MDFLFSASKPAFRWKLTPEVIEHSITPVLGQQFSAKEFYAGIKETLNTQKIPGLEITDFYLFEGGPLSDERLYLKIKRERLVVDVCAAPLGANFFFSYRFVELPTKIALHEIGILCLALGLCWWIGSHLIGFFVGSIVFFVFLCFSAWLMRNAIGLGLQDLDKALLNVPVVSALYDRYLRKDTYYRQDARIMYRFLVADVIKAAVERYTAGKGVKLLREFTYAPLLDLYRSNAVAAPSNESTT